MPSPWCRLLVGVLALAAAAASPAEPFATRNQSPLARLYGLPAAAPAALLAADRREAVVRLDIANNFTRRMLGGETIWLDGETYELTLALRGGAGWHGRRVEWGVELPLVAHSGGLLDDAIDDWHDALGLRDGGRSRVASDLLRYSYERDGVELLRVDRAASGLGDLRLTAGLGLDENPAHPVALRAQLKLPTGDSERLFGSGGADIALWLVAARALGDRWRADGALGGALLARGDVLPAQQQRAAAFGHLGLSVRVVDDLRFRIQLDGHTALFDDTALPQLGKHALQVVLGWQWRPAERVALDLAFAEDLVDFASPDLSLYLQLRAVF
jgi:hypothetical protein